LSASAISPQYLALFLSHNIGKIRPPYPYYL
jgi:hypothetical protein